METEENSKSGLPVISVIIPAHNPGSSFLECLDPFTRVSYQDFEVIVVDDASPSPVELPGFTLNWGRILRLDTNLGPAGARNEGAAGARGDILLFIDTDVVIGEDCLEAVGRFYLDDDKRNWGLTGIQSTRMKFDNFSSQYKNLWLRYSFLQSPVDSALFYTSIAAVPRDLFHRLNGFDLQYTTPSLEDTDFGNRIWEEGGKVRIDRELEVRHNKYYSLLGLLKNDFKRASDETRTWLRNRGKTGTVFSGRTSVPLGFIAGLAFAGVGVLGGLVWLVFYSLIGLWIVIIALLGIWISNVSMLNYMRRIMGPAFLIQLLLFLPLNMLVAGSGIVWGISSYLIGRKY
jgi:GT2 family glycosyltransferase